MAIELCGLPALALLIRPETYRVSQAVPLFISLCSPGCMGLRKVGRGLSSSIHLISNATSHKLQPQRIIVG